MNTDNVDSSDNQGTLTPEQFEQAHGVADWRVIDGGASTVFSTGSFAKGVELVDEIGALADAAGHHPDVDLRYPHVTVRIVTHDAGNALTTKDVFLAREISAAAQRLGIEANPAAL